VFARHDLPPGTKYQEVCRRLSRRASPSPSPFSPLRQMAYMLFAKKIILRGVSDVDESLAEVGSQGWLLHLRGREHIRLGSGSTVHTCVCLLLSRFSRVTNHCEKPRALLCGQNCVKLETGASTSSPLSYIHSPPSSPIRSEQDRDGIPVFTSPCLSTIPIDLGTPSTASPAPSFRRTSPRHLSDLTPHPASTFACGSSPRSCLPKRPSFTLRRCPSGCRCDRTTTE